MNCMSMGAGNCLHIVSDDFRALDQNLPLGWVNRYVIGDHKWCASQHIKVQIFDDEGIACEALVSL